MHGLGFTEDDMPSVSTIKRIVKIHGLKVNKRERYKRVKSKKRYTILNPTRIDEMHQMDFVGPRFIRGYGAVGINEKTPEVHRRVVSDLYRRNPVIANKLHLLRRQRNFADYDMGVTLRVNDAESAIVLAEAVINEVST